MAWREIRLPGGVWGFDDQATIGEKGGFGAVLRGTSADGQPVAVKRLNLSMEEAHHREMKVAEELKGRTLPGIIPVFDSGEDAVGGGYFLVMALAEQSLESYAKKRGPVDELEAAQIIEQIAGGLIDARMLVHRDLKPANVLFHEGRWKIADFGIPRFVEESTSARTMRDCLSPEYAAPEQWKGEAIANAADVYALGCIAYRLLSGSPPHPGPGLEDYKRQHLEKTPPRLEKISPRLASLIDHMMRKIPATRPDIARVVKSLQSREEQRSPAHMQLAKADAVVGADVAERQAAAEREARIGAERVQLHSYASEVLTELAEKLTGQIQEGARNAQITKAKAASLAVWKVRCGHGQLELNLHEGVVLSASLFPRSGWDVVAAGSISVVQNAGYPAFLAARVRCVDDDEILRRRRGNRGKVLGHQLLQLLGIAALVLVESLDRRDN